MQEGDPGDKFYIIARGKAEAHKQTADGERLRLSVMGDGDFFGELALLRNSPRTATVTTLSCCSFLTLNRNHFLDLLEQALACARNSKKLSPGENSLHHRTRYSLRESWKSCPI